MLYGFSVSQFGEESPCVYILAWVACHSLRQVTMVKAEDSWPRGLGFESLLRKLFFWTIQYFFCWIKSKKQKEIMESSNQFDIVACAVSNPANWRLNFEAGWNINSSWWFPVSQMGRGHSFIKQNLIFWGQD